MILIRFRGKKEKCKIKKRNIVVTRDYHPATGRIYTRAYTHTYMCSVLYLEGRAVAGRERETKNTEGRQIAEVLFLI